jgi:iron complex transport system substrate-binding protein
MPSRTASQAATTCGTGPAIDVSTSPRIVSLLPAATEIAAALGLGDALVGRSHECDHPPEVARLPALTAPRIDAAGSSRAIHEQVERATAMFTLDAAQLAALRPDVILTQAACDVCAVAEADVAAAARTLDPPARVVSLSSTTLAGVFADILAVGAATGRLAKAREVVARLQARCDSVACRTRALTPAAGRPRVAMIEWLDPPMAAGNWVPEMVRLAGGDDVLGHPGEHSHWIGWDDVATADPDVVVLVPCGFTLDRVLAEAASAAVRPHLESLRAFAQDRVWTVDGHHLFNRPGPRLVDSLEVLAEIVHPGQFAFAATRQFARRPSVFQ